MVVIFILFREYYINDAMCYCNHKNSPLYVCSLDAEKCFDSIWHPALFYKLKDTISHTFWLFLIKWYEGLRVVVKWKGHYSHIFTVTRGTRQGSILSPQVFNICIDDVLQSLQFLIQMCADYAHKLRFIFGIKKTKCMIVEYHKFYVEP